MVDVTPDGKTRVTVEEARRDFAAFVVVAASGANLALAPWQLRLAVALERIEAATSGSVTPDDLASVARKYPPAPPARPSAFSLTADGERRPFGFQPNRRERRAAVAAGRRHRRSDG